jgi:hypothetical protein
VEAPGYFLTNDDIFDIDWSLIGLIVTNQRMNE